MKKEKNRPQLNIRITEEEKKLLQQDAEGEDRSISNFLLWCWKQWKKNKRK